MVTNKKRKVYLVLFFWAEGNHWMACSNRQSHNYSQSKFTLPLTLCLLSFARIIKTWLDLRELETKLSISRESHSNGRLVPSSGSVVSVATEGRTGMRKPAERRRERERIDELQNVILKNCCEMANCIFIACSMKFSNLSPFIRHWPSDTVWTFLRALCSVSHILFWLKPRDHDVTASVDGVSLCAKVCNQIPVMCGITHD